MIRPLNPDALKRKATPTVPVGLPDVKFLELYGEPIAYDANSMAAVALDRTTWLQAQDAKGLLHGTLGSLDMPQAHCFPRSPVRKLVLNVTHGCNLACPYCFAQGYDEAQTMTPDMARRAIDWAFGDGKGPISIAFFGGEPLLAWDTLTAAVEYAETPRRQTAFHVTTNGVALDADKAEYIRKHNISVLLSLDGPADLHNPARPLRGREYGSFGHVMCGLSCLNGAEITPMIRGTYPMDNPALMERIAYYTAQFDADAITGFSLEPAVLTEGCGARQCDGVDWDDLEKQYHDTALWYVERVKAGKPAPFFHYRKLLSRLQSATPQCTECGAGNGYITCGPDGTLYACHRETGTDIGHLDYGLDESRRCAWADNRIYAREGCMQCWARYICGGGCRQQSVEAGASTSHPLLEGCRVMQIMARECLWILTQI